MKKILSFILVLAMILGCVSMVSFASDEATTTDEPVLGGGYIRAYNRLQSTVSFPRYDLKDKITTAGTYHIQCYVRIPAYTSGNYYVTLYFMNADNNGTKVINVQNTEWKLVEWDVTVSNTEASAYYLRIDTTDATDFCLDAVSVRKVNGDGTLGENLVEDSNCDLVANTGWYGQNCKIINPEKAVKISNAASGYVFVSSKGVWNDDGNAGLKYVSFDIYNPSDSDVTFRNFMAVYHDSGWRDLAFGDSGVRNYTVPAHGKITITRSVEFNADGKVSCTRTTTGYYNPSEVAVRFDNITVGANLYIKDTRSDAFYIYGTANAGAVTIEEIPAYTENKAIKFTFNNDYSTYAELNTAKYTGYSQSEIKTDEENGEKYILRQYAVYNNSDHFVLFQMKFLAFTSSKYCGITGMTFPDNPTQTDGNVHLKPYETRLYSIKIPVNANNKISWQNGDGSSGEALLDELFVRYYLNPTLNNSNGSYAMKAGDEIIIQPLGDSYSDNIYLLASTSSDYTVTKLQDLSEVNDLKGASLTLGSSLTYNITAMTEYGKDAMVKVTRTGKNNAEYVSEITPVNGVANYTVNAQCMGDNIKIELYVGNVLVDTIDNYSIKQYAINQFNKYPEDTLLKTLLSDMLVYGAEAQKAIGYKTDALVNEGLSITLTPSSNGAPTAEAVISTDNTLISSATLNISHVNKIRFKIANGVDTTNLTVTINDAPADIIQGKYVYTDDIMATGFADEYTITVSDGTNTATVTYSANVYIANKFESTTVAGETTIGALCKALNNYGQSAIAYKG